MSAPTPGPWHVYNGGDIFSALGSDSGDGVMAADNDGWHIAEIPQTPTTTAYGDEVELGWEVMRANARLIAAAPDLLEALEALLAKVECGTALKCDLCDQARAAIAKAKSSAPEVQHANP